MTGRYKRSQNNNRSRFYIFLSVVFVVFMFKWGVPLLTNLVAGNGAQRTNTERDIIPPQAPIISALPNATNSARISIEGFTEKGATVELLLNDVSEKMSVADEEGVFEFVAFLISGQNRIQLRAKDEKGNESMSEVSLVELDTKPIELIISSPKDGSEYFGRTNQVVDIKGSIDKPSGEITINNSFVLINRDGSFVHRFLLSGGENSIKVVAQDKAGNGTEITLRLIYTP